MICEIDATDLKDTSDPTELQIMWCSWWNFIDEEGKSASYFDGEMSDGKAKDWV